MTRAVSRPVAVARAALVGVGVLLVGVAGGLLTAGVPVRQWPGILLWLAAAVVLHDAVFAPLVLVGTRVLRRIGARVPWSQVAVVQVALVVGAALALLAFPGIRAEQIGARNDSVLVSDYGLELLLAWGVLGAVSAVVVTVLGVRRRRKARRPVARARGEQPA